jgi:hypothetical protein
MALRKQLPALVGFIAGIVVMMSFFSESKALALAATDLVSWRTILAAFALALGGANLLRVNYRRSASGLLWQRLPSAILIGALLVTISVGLAQGTTSGTYAFLYDSIYRSGAATVFSLNAFFIVSAAYRAFRIKDGPSIVFMLAGSMVMLGQVGIGQVMWSGLPVLSSWIMRVPNMGAMRGITIGASLGVIGLGLRVMLGLERRHFGAE